MCAVLVTEVITPSMRLAFDSLMQPLSQFSRYGQADDPGIPQRRWRPIPASLYFLFPLHPPAVADVITPLPSHPLGNELQLRVGRPSQGPPAWHMVEELAESEVLRAGRREA
jgi:hypothetical protein